MIAHIRQSDGQEQSVECHCLQTANYARIAGKSVGMEQLAFVAGLLHDMGKLSSAFDAYIHGDSHYYRGSIDHCFAGAKYLSELAENEIFLHKKAQFLKTAEFLGHVILSHHGLHDWIDEEGKDYFHARIMKTENYKEILENAKNISFFQDCPEKFQLAEAEFSVLKSKIKSIVSEMPLSDATAKNKNEILSFYLGMAERLMTSILIDADRTDTADFISNVTIEKSFDSALLWEKMQKRMEQRLSEFSERTDRISKQRNSISERCAAFAEHSVKICRLIVPTGGGKTLSALRFAIAYCRRYHKKRIFYIAPFLSILEQNSDEIRKIAGDDEFLEHHSDAMNEILQKENTDELHSYELHTERWDSPVIATTMVQFLDSLFSAKTSAVRRMHQLSESVIIIDEIQSLPTKCVYMFNLAMNFLSRICGSVIVLCSATQPPFELLKKYPLLLDSNSSMTGETVGDFSVFRRTYIENYIKEDGYSYEEAAEFCLAKQPEYGSLLMIVNTKLAAREIFQRLQQDSLVPIFHLSTNMCPQHRREQIQKIRERLEQHLPIICVTTQLIEAGVDISFGCVVRSLAGMDSIAQASGRCNRNGESETACPVFILDIWEEKLANLEEIQAGQDISLQMLDNTEKRTDLLGVEMMSEYFRKFYHENKEQLVYPYRNENLIDLLSLNHDRNLLSGRTKANVSGQAFATAGQAFNVIENNTQSLLVPFNEEAKTLIAELNTNKTPSEIRLLLRKAQPYMAGVYPQMFRKLQEENAIFSLTSGVLTVDERYYHSEYGLTEEAGMQQNFIL